MTQQNSNNNNTGIKYLEENWEKRM